MEKFILKKIASIKERLAYMATHRNEFSKNDFMALFNRYTGQIDILNQVLTGHDNLYEIS